MDAVRLIVTSRRALAGSKGVPEMMTEVWQAQALAQAPALQPDWLREWAFPVHRRNFAR